MRPRSLYLVRDKGGIKGDFCISDEFLHWFGQIMILVVGNEILVFNILFSKRIQCEILAVLIAYQRNRWHDCYTQIGSYTFHNSGYRFTQNIRIDIYILTAEQQINIFTKVCIVEGKTNKIPSSLSRGIQGYLWWRFC